MQTVVNHPRISCELSIQMPKATFASIDKTKSVILSSNGMCLFTIWPWQSHVALSSTASLEHFPPLSSCDIRNSQLFWKIGWPLPHHSLHFLSLARESAADVVVGQEATSVCQLCHKYKQGRGSLYGVPAQGQGCVMTSSRLGWLVETLWLYFMLCHFRGEWGCN